ncbi:MAG: helix-turn-helix domain-containing protein [Alphaproteobacteria bacterium]|nr:helix-turn-helix domain-containing protein [Alphaproteobacteria bacterium]
MAGETAAAECDEGQRTRCIDVVVVVLDDLYASTAVGPVEVFQAAGVLWNRINGLDETPLFNVRLASLDGKGVKCSIATLSADCRIDEVANADIIFLPTGGAETEQRWAEREPLLQWLRHWYHRGASIAAACTGVEVLAQSGLLDGRRATVHWSKVDNYRQWFPKVAWQAEKLVTEDDRLFCGGGIYAAADVGMLLVEKYSGHSVALQCAKALCLDMPRTRQTSFFAVGPVRTHGDETIRRVEDFLRLNLAGDLTVEDLAARANMGLRTFNRRFKAATGFAPGSYLREMRITVARNLLEEGLEPIQTISEKVGYADVAFFRSIFKRHTGMSPREYRGRYGIAEACR